MVEVVQVHPLGSTDTIVTALVCAGAIGAGDHQSVQHGEEDRALDRKFEAAVGEKFVQYGSVKNLGQVAVCEAISLMNA
jgi:hypothetical protein